MAMNIEQRLEQSAKSIEQSSQKAHDFAEKDITLQTCAGSRDSLPKVSRIWQENFARQMNQHATEFQDRFALSQQSLPWQAGITISDSLQRYHVGVQGEEGYKEFLPNPVKLPFETAATLAEDLTQDRWLENGVPNKHWTESKVASALEKSLGVNARIWPKDRDLVVGDVIPAPEDTADGLPITHLIVDGNAYAMSPIEHGLVSLLSETGATIGGVSVIILPTLITNETQINIPASMLPAALGHPSLALISAKVTIAVTGSAVFSEPLEYSGSGGENLAILGESLSDMGVVTSAIFNGYDDLSNYASITLGVAGLSAGDWVSITNVKSPAAEVGKYISGLWKVTSATASTATIAVKCWMNPEGSSITSASVKKYNVALRFNNCDGVVSKSKIGLIDNIAIIGNSDEYWDKNNVSATEKGTHGIYSGGLSVLDNDWNNYSVGSSSISLGQNVGVNGFDQQGVVSDQSSSIFAYNVISCNNKRRGFYSAGGKIRNKFAVANGNFLDGMISDYGNSIESSVAVCCGNGGSAVSAVNGSSLSSPNSHFELNATGSESKSGGTCITSNSVHLKNSVRDSLCDFGTLISRGSSFLSTGESHRAFFGRSDLRDSSFNQLASVHINAQQSDVLISNSDATKFFSDDSSIRDNNSYQKSDIKGDKYFKNDVRFFSGGANYFRPTVSSTGDLGLNLNNQTILTVKADKTSFYANDRATSAGRSSNPFSTVYATNGTIQPSDANLKTEKQNIPDGVFRAWGEVRQKFGMWMWLPEFKESDRYHFGPYAQDIVEAFERYGEDPYKYALNCYDEWKDEYDDDGALILEGGKRLGIKPHEIFMLEIAYNVWKETAE
ncbi:tail fiber domain-containing protein [Vibrio cholerae]|uniref:tail fiber domain-containing protein n=1 Tax=Vibrio cholerae TaxID=666 RepID=UPI003080C2A9